MSEIIGENERNPQVKGPDMPRSRIVRKDDGEIVVEAFDGRDAMGAERWKAADGWVVVAVLSHFAEHVEPGPLAVADLKATVKALVPARGCAR